MPGQLLEVPLGGVEGPLGAVVVHVADVRGQPGASPVGQGRRCSSGRRRPRAPVRRRTAGGPASARSRGSGGPAAAAPSTTRTTESSQGTWIGRSWVSQASASAASRVRASSSSVTIGSPATLPLVITSTRGPGRVARQPEQQVVHRRVGRASRRGRGCPGATPVGEREVRARRTSRGGAAARSDAGARRAPGASASSSRATGGRVRRRRPSPRTACPRVACACAAVATGPAVSRRRRRGGSRRVP